MLKILFIVVLCIKIAASLYAFRLGFDQNAEPLNSFSTLLSDPIWLWSFSIPLFFMLLYVVVGWLFVRKKPQNQLFAYANSCYYLGFLFTVASIIIALTCIRDENFYVSEVAIRFAAAMLTTFIGMAVRLVIVTFHTDNRKLQLLSTNPVSSTSTPDNQPKEGTENTEHDNKQKLPSPITADPEDDFNFILQVSCQNLAILNNQLVQSINKFGQLLDLMMNAKYKITSDQEIEKEKVAEFNNQLQIQSQESIKKATEDFSSSLKKISDSASSFFEDLKDNNLQSTKGLTDSLNKEKDSLNELLTKFNENLTHSQDMFEKALLAEINNFKDLNSKNLEEQADKDKELILILSNQISTTFNELSRTVSRPFESIEITKLNESIISFSDCITEATNNFKKSSEENNNALIDVRRKINSLNFSNHSNEVNEELLNFKSKIASLGDKLKETSICIENFNHQINTANDQIKQTTEEVSRIPNSFKNNNNSSGKGFLTWFRK